MGARSTTSAMHTQIAESATLKIAKFEHRDEVNHVPGTEAGPARKRVVKGCRRCRRAGRPTRGSRRGWRVREQVNTTIAAATMTRVKIRSRSRPC